MKSLGRRFGGRASMNKHLSVSLREPAKRYRRCRDGRKRLGKSRKPPKKGSLVVNGRYLSIVSPFKGRCPRYEGKEVGNCGDQRK